MDKIQETVNNIFKMIQEEKEDRKKMMEEWDRK